MLIKALLPLAMILAMASSSLNAQTANPFASPGSEQPPTPAATEQTPTRNEKPKKTAVIRKKLSAEYYFSFLEYRYNFNQRVQKRWKGLVEANRDKLQPVQLTIHYYISSEGYISVMSPEAGQSYTSNTNEYKLAQYALALENKEPVPFPDVVKKEFPKGFFYQVTLAIQ